MGRLTTHVLDTARGRPGSGIAVSVARIAGQTREVVARGETNADGRCDRPLPEGDALAPGVYELVFSVAPYFARQGMASTDPPFLGDVVLRFGVADPSQHYHVPLLVTPWSYATYRGS
jgi:5-hydroxyisourate hydrolase